MCLYGRSDSVAAYSIPAIFVNILGLIGDVMLELLKRHKRWKIVI